MDPFTIAFKSLSDAQKITRATSTLRIRIPDIWWVGNCVQFLTNYVRRPNDRWHVTANGWQLADTSASIELAGREYIYRYGNQQPEGWLVFKCTPDVEMGDLLEFVYQIKRMMVKFQYALQPIVALTEHGTEVVFDESFEAWQALQCRTNAKFVSEEYVVVTLTSLVPDESLHIISPWALFSYIYIYRRLPVAIVCNSREVNAMLLRGKCTHPYLPIRVEFPVPSQIVTNA